MIAFYQSWRPGGLMGSVFWSPVQAYMVNHLSVQLQTDWREVENTVSLTKSHPCLMKPEKLWKGWGAERLVVCNMSAAFQIWMCRHDPWIASCLNWRLTALHHSYKLKKVNCGHYLERKRWLSRLQQPLLCLARSFPTYCSCGCTVKLTKKWTVRVHTLQVHNSPNSACASFTDG